MNKHKKSLKLKLTLCNVYDFWYNSYFSLLSVEKLFYLILYFQHYLSSFDHFDIFRIVCLISTLATSFPINLYLGVYPEFLQTSKTEYSATTVNGFKFFNILSLFSNVIAGKEFNLANISSNWSHHVFIT